MEINRMKIIYHDIQTIFLGKQVLFVRYNPDNYDNKAGVEKKKQRLEYLYTIVTYIKQYLTIGTQLGYIKLFYDKFTGIPIIELLNITLNNENYHIYGDDAQENN